MEKIRGINVTDYDSLYDDDSSNLVSDGNANPYYSSAGNAPIVTGKQIPT